MSNERKHNIYETPPNWCKNAIPTVYGWVNPENGELLISIRGLKNPVSDYNRKLKNVKPLIKTLAKQSTEPSTEPSIIPSNQTTIDSTSDQIIEDTSEDTSEDTTEKDLKDNNTDVNTDVNTDISAETPKKRGRKPKTAITN